MRAPGVEVHLAWGAASHRGARRTLNEDRFLASNSVFFVADGMGGHDAGEVASSVTIEALRPLAALPTIQPEDLLERLVVAQERVKAISTEPGRGAGTTVSGVAVASQRGLPYWLVANIGDSRTYRLSRGVLEQISHDHSEVQEMIDAGLLTPGQAMTYPRRHVVTRAIGARAEVQPDFWYVPICARDRMVICSDGLTGELSNDRITEILLARPEPQNAADHLVHEAIVAGGRDNVTVVVIDAVGVSQGSLDDTTTPRHLDRSVDEDTLPRDIRFQMGRQS